MTAVVQQYRLEIPSKPENIALVEHFVDEIKEQYELGDDIFGNILIALTEAVNNGIIHGNKMDENKMVVVECKKDNRLLSFVVSDEGDGFDYNNLPDPTDPRNLEKITGRGVFLMKQLSDFLIYSKGGSQVELQFKV
jgi:serine/threonine-protein kinase RsbW